MSKQKGNTTLRDEGWAVWFIKEDGSGDCCSGHWWSRGGAIRLFIANRPGLKSWAYAKSRGYRVLRTTATATLPAKKERKK